MIRDDMVFTPPARDSVRMNWRTLQRLVRSYGLLILTVMTATLLASYVALAFVSDRYETAAKLVVRLGRQHLEPPPTVRNAGPLFSNGVRREEISSEIQVLQSPDLAAATIDAIGLDAFRPTDVRPSGLLPRIRYEGKQLVRQIRTQIHEIEIGLGITRRLNEREETIAWLISALDVIPERDSDVISLSLRTGDPAFGQQILSKYIELFLKKRIDVSRTSGVNEYLAVELRTATERLRNAEAGKLAWKQQRSLSSGPEQLNLLLRQARELISETSQTKRQMESLAREAETSKALLASTPRTLATRRQEAQNPVLTNLRQELSKLEMERSQLLTRFHETTPQVQDTDEQIARVKQLISSQASRETLSTFETNPLATELERQVQSDSIQLAGLNARYALQQQQTADLEREIRSIDEAEARLAGLERDRQLAEQEYLSLTRRLQDAELSSDLERRRISNVNILHAPASSIGPVAPKRRMLLMAAMFLGLVFGCGIALALHLLDNRVRDARELAESTGMTWLGSVAPPRPAAGD